MKDRKRMLEIILDNKDNESLKELIFKYGIYKKSIGMFYGYILGSSLTFLLLFIIL